MKGLYIRRRPFRLKLTPDMRRLHLTFGAVGVVVFLMTGQYMDRWLGHLAGMPDLPRMLYRSAHIYLLFAALLNLLLGLYGDDHPRGWRRGITKLGSVLILIAPVMILIGFDREASRTDFERPFVGFAIYGCFAGVLLHALAGIGRRR
jgi:hypothetical protein